MLRPSGLRRLERQRRRGGGGDFTIRADENGFHTARADVETEKQGYRTPSSSSIVS